MISEIKLVKALNELLEEIENSEPGSVFAIDTILHILLMVVKGELSDD